MPAIRWSTYASARLIAPAVGAVYQYSAPVEGRRAYLWIPPRYTEVRGIILSLSSPLKRDAAAGGHPNGMLAPGSSAAGSDRGGPLDMKASGVGLKLQLQSSVAQHLAFADSRLAGAQVEKRK